MPALIAHRGFPQHHPENTLAGLEAAAALGASHVEIDVQLSREGVPVLFHDTDLRRLCGVEGEITALGLVEIRGLRVEGEALPTLAAFAAWLQAHPGLHAFVELKQESIAIHGEAAMLAAVDGALRAVRSRCTLISFDAGVLALATSARWRTGWVTDAWPEDLPPGIEVWFCDVKALPPAGRLDGHMAPLAVYEVADPRLAERLAARGVSFVESFDIGGMRRALPAWT